MKNLNSKQLISNFINLKTLQNSKEMYSSSHMPFFIIRNARTPKLSPCLSQSNSQQFLPNYNRKEKSLEELSRKFLQMFLNSQETFISLDRITDSLGVERRRIYDIINILESLNLVTRKGKNNYRWNGFRRVYETIEGFEGLDFKQIRMSSCSGFQVKREKSLKLLSIGFLGLFLRWKNTMTLEEAAKNLSNEGVNPEDHKIKTKIRRLYDIANVFKSLGLIKKTLLLNKKPAFHWLGIPGLDEFVSLNKDSSKIPIEFISKSMDLEKNNEKTKENEGFSKELLVKCLMSLLEGNKNDEKLTKKTINLQTQQERSMNFVTPIIKKTLTIIYPRTEDTQITSTPLSNSNSLQKDHPLDHSDLEPKTFDFSLKESTNCIKRKPLGCISQGLLDISRQSSFKKIKKEDDIGRDKENIRPTIGY